MYRNEVLVVLQGADYADDGSTKESKGSREKGKHLLCIQSER
jgi:hypothetical protein